MHCEYFAANLFYASFVRAMDEQRAQHTRTQMQQGQASMQRIGTYYIGIYNIHTYII